MDKVGERKRTELSDRKVKANRIRYFAFSSFITPVLFYRGLS